MKRALLAALLLLPVPAFAEMAETRLHVTGLTCPSCSYIVATALRNVDTVEILEFAEGEAQDGTYVIRFDDAVTNPDGLIAAVAGIGYAATLAEDPQS